MSSHPKFPLLVQAIRIIQFIAAIVSLGLFAKYLTSLAIAISKANGAVIGILVAAVAWVMVITLVGCFVPLGGVVIRLLTTVLDASFVGAFIGVAVLTSPAMRIAGKCGAINVGDGDSDDNQNDVGDDDDDTNFVAGPSCGLVNGTFALAIVST